MTLVASGPECERIMELYYHKTSGGAEYLTDKFIVCPNGHKEAVFDGANYIVRIDGDIETDAEITITSNNYLLEACKMAMEIIEDYEDFGNSRQCEIVEKCRESILKAESE